MSNHSQAFPNTNDRNISDNPTAGSDPTPTSVSTSPIRSTTSSSYPRYQLAHLTERSHSLSSPPPTPASITNIPLSTSPVMPYLPNLSLTTTTPNNSLSMSPTNITSTQKRWSISSSEDFTQLHLPQPSLPSKNQKAVDDALASERSRTKEMERKENDMSSVNDIKLILKRERSRMTKLVGEIAALKSMSVASQAEAEVCEEGRINGLMRRMDCLQKEKGRIIVELEREEEMLTNTLQKKLNEVRREKAELERQIEKEHSYNLELKAKLDKMMQSNNRPHTAVSVDSSTPSLKSENTNEE